MVTSRLSVFVIDDDEQDIELLRRQLEEIPDWAFDVRAFTDADEAFMELGRCRVDLTFLDYLLGAESGTQVLGKIRDAGYTRPVIVLTGKGDERVAAEITRTGADDYLVKGELTPDLLRRAMEGALARYRLRQEKSRLREELTRAQRLEVLDQVAGGLAHELNNLIMIMLSHLEIVKKATRTDAEPVRGSLDAIQKAGSQASLLADKLLAFGRQQRLVPQTLRLDSVVIDVIQMLRPLLGVTIELVTDLAQTGQVEVDPGKMQQVLINLALNARDAMPAGGRLTIRTSDISVSAAESGPHARVKPGPYVVLEVTDTGTGMSEATLDHIFQPFFTTKRVGQGTGLGLAMVHGIIRQSGGLILVESQPRVGSTFRVYLPRLT